MSIKCGHCGHRHVDVAEVRTCADASTTRITMPEAVDRAITMLGASQLDHEHDLAIEQEFIAARGSEETDGEPFPEDWVRCPVEGCAGAHKDIAAVRAHETENGSRYVAASLHNVSCCCGVYDRCMAWRRTNARTHRDIFRAYND